ncbi:MAG: 1-acyl-sn-glycerol-3-phosphate acyltransferase [Longimicrobiales bacterium]
MLTGLITRLVGWAASIFYEVERTGPELADGPVLVVANHPNALVDPLVVFRTGRRPIRPLAKAPLFDQALVGTVLRGLGGLPVYRREDDPGQMHRNERTFDAAVAALTRGEAVQIYPEGHSHSEPALAPLRTGAARIVLQAEADAGWTLGLRVQAVGLTYSRKEFFGGKVVAAWGAPFRVSEWRDAYEPRPRQAVSALTERIRTELEARMLTLERPEDRELVEVAERLYAREKQLAGWREPGSMADRLPRLRGFALGLSWLRANDPERLDALVVSVRRYVRLLSVFGASDGDVPPRYEVTTVVLWLVRQIATVVIGLPVALAGIVLWAPPYLFSRHVTPMFRPKADQVASYKLGAGLVAFPVWLILLSVASFLACGVRGVVICVFVAPLVGLLTAAWRQWGSRAREDVLVWWRALRRREERDRMAAIRSALVREFDAVGRLLRAAGRPSSAGDGGGVP